MDDLSSGSELSLSLSHENGDDELPQRIRKLRWIGRMTEADELARRARHSGRALVCGLEAETD